jgi:uncharacterized protein (TIGR02001 family)
MLCLAIASCPLQPTAAAAADLTATAALLSDFRFRGVSLTDRRPALQAGLDWSGESGAMAGALASNVRVAPLGEDKDALAGQIYLGWSGTWTAPLSWGAGAAYYAFRPKPDGASLDYPELFLRLRAHDVQVGVYASNSYFGSGATSAYLSVSASRELLDRVRLFAQVGALRTGAARPDYYFYDHARRLDARVGTLIDLRPFSVELSVVGATSHDNGCTANRKPCEPGLVLAVSRAF